MAYKYPWLISSLDLAQLKFKNSVYIDWFQEKGCSLKSPTQAGNNSLTSDQRDFSAIAAVEFLLTYFQTRKHSAWCCQYFRPRGYRLGKQCLRVLKELLLFPKGLIYKAANSVVGFGWKSHCLGRTLSSDLCASHFRKLFTSYFLWKQREVVFLFKDRGAKMHQVQLMMMMKLVIKCTVSNSPSFTLPWGSFTLLFYFMWIWSMLEYISVSNPAFVFCNVTAYFYARFGAGGGVNLSDLQCTRQPKILGWTGWNCPFCRSEMVKH